MATRKDLPSEKATNFSQRLRETIQTYLGNQGDPLDRGVTLRDLVESGIVELPSWWKGGSRTVPMTPGQGITDGIESAELDLTPPPTPTGFEARGLVAAILILHDGPAFRAGGGYLSTIVYGATREEGDPAPTFSDAVQIHEFQGGPSSYATNPATTWHLWIKWKTKAGVLSTSPAGGTNGLVVRTAEDVAKLLEAMAGSITESQLFADLNTRIDKIDGPANLDGSVSARLASEALARANAIAIESDARIAAIDAEVTARNAAIGVEVLDRANAVSNEAMIRTEAVAQEARQRMDLAQDSAETMLRNVLSINATALAAADTVAIARRELKTDIQDGLSAEAAERLTLIAKLDTDIATTRAVVAEESIARVTADEAEAAQRALLAAQLLGPDGTTLTQGLIFNERSTRATQDNALAQQITLLSAGAGEQFDWAKIWYFDASIEGWTGISTPTMSGGWLKPVGGPAVTSPSGLGIDAAKYTQIRLRVRKTGTLTWSGVVDWNGGSTTAAEPTYDANGIGLVTINPGWSGTISYISFSGYTTQGTGSDYYELDWVAVGRPSPGASSAQLLELERVTVDVANSTSLASKLTALTAEVNGPTGLTAAVSTIADEYVVQADINSTSASAQQVLLSQFGATSKTWVSATRPGFVLGAQTNPNISVTLADGTVSQRPTYKNGDLWIDSANGNAVYAWATNAWVASTDSSVLGTAAFSTAWENTYATGSGSGATSIRALNAAYVGGDIATSSDISDVQEVLSDAIESVARDTRILKSQSAEFDGALLTSILNTEAAKESFKGEIALAREELQTNIVAGLSAEASKRLELVAVVNTNAAALTQEQIARATQDGALAQSIETLTSTVDGNQATLVTDYYTKANADLATVQSQKALVANFGAASVFRENEPPVQGTVSVVLSNGDTGTRVKIRTGDLWFDLNDGNKPHIWNGSAWVYAPNTSVAASEAYLLDLENALATADTAEVTALRSLKAAVLDPETGLAATRSDLTVEQEARATSDGSLAREVRTLKSQSAELSDIQLLNLLNGEQAKVTFKGEIALAREELQTNIATGISAEASKRLELAAVVNANAAALTLEQTTRATQDEATAQSVLNLNSVVNDNQALLVSSYRTKATQDLVTAESLNALQSRMEDPTGSIGVLTANLTQNYYTKVAADGIIAQQKTNLRAYSATSSSRTFRQATEPARRGYDELGVSIPLQVGDIWFDTGDSERPYICTAGGSSYAWEARDTTFAQPTAPVNPPSGSLWIDTDDDNKLYGWSGSAWVAYRDGKLTEVIADVETIETAKIGYSTQGGVTFDNNGTIKDKADMLAWNTANPGVTQLVWNVGLPLAQAIKKVGVTVPAYALRAGAVDAALTSQTAVDNWNVSNPTDKAVWIPATTLTLEDKMEALQQANGKLYAQKSVKLGTDNSVVGYGLSGEVGADGAIVESKFVVNVDKFAVATPTDSMTVWATNTTYAKGAVTRVVGNDTKSLVCTQGGQTSEAQPDMSQPIGTVLTLGGTNWQIASRVPFSVATVPFTHNGQDVPIGTFIDGAYVRNLSATNITTGVLDATVIYSGTINASKITAGSIAVGQHIQSSNYIASTQGWRIDGNGSAEFGSASIRGQLAASQIDTRGLTIKDDAGNVLFGSGQNLDISRVAGKGALATRDTITPAFTIGFGDLAVQNTVSTGQVTGLGALATQGSVQMTSSDGSTQVYMNGAPIKAEDLVSRLQKIGTGNISTFIESAAIGDAYIGNLNAGKITAGTIAADRLDSAIVSAKVANIQTAQIGNAQITSAKIGNAEVDTLKIAGNAATYFIGDAVSGNSALVTFSLPYTAEVICIGSCANSVASQSDIYINSTSQRAVNTEGSIAMVFKTQLAAGSHEVAMVTTSGTNASIAVAISYR